MKQRREDSKTSASLYLHHYVMSFCAEMRRHVVVLVWLPANASYSSYSAVRVRAL